MGRILYSPLFFIEGFILMHTLKLLSYNIQVSIPMEAARHYLLRSWRHFIPHAGRLDNLKKIAAILKDYDVVGLQEVDAGSIRSSFINQVEYLGREAGFLCWETQINRNFKLYAKYSNGILSRFPISDYQDYKLPGRIKGRGVMTCRIGSAERSILFAVAHLSLTEKAQKRQLDFMAELLQSEKNVVMMGDLNIEPQKLAGLFLEKTGLLCHPIGEPTYPSWKPTRQLDYVITSPHLKIRNVEVLPFRFSDHLPVAVELEWPA